MPQPLSRVRANAEMGFWVGALAQRPALAVKAMEAIGCWASYEAAMTRLLAFMLGGQSARPAALIMQSLVSGPAKVEALRAVAESVLSGDLLDYFGAIQRYAKTVAAQRHAMAHHLWGMSPELPDALLLADPKDAMSASVLLVEWAHEQSKAGTLWTEMATQGAARMFDPEAVMVYREADFEHVKLVASDAAVWMHYLSVAVWHLGLAGPEAPRPLLDEPRFAKALSEYRQRKNS